MPEPVEFWHPACNSGDTRLPGRMSPSSLDGYLPGCSLKHTLDKQHKGHGYALQQLAVRGREPVDYGCHDERMVRLNVVSGGTS